MDIKDLLKESGLDVAIPIFELHKITTPQLSEMNRDDFKELLPALGDRLKLLKAMKQGRGVKGQPITSQRKKSFGHFTSTKRMIKNDPKKRAFIVEMLKNERHLADLYQMASKVLIDFSLFSFDEGCRPKSPDWTLIDFATGKLNCLLCKEKIQLQTRNDCATLWNVGNFKRHFAKEHKKNDCLGTEETNQISSFLEVVLTKGSKIGDMEEDNLVGLSNGVQNDQQQIDDETLDTVQNAGKTTSGLEISATASLGNDFPTDQGVDAVLISIKSTLQEIKKPLGKCDSESHIPTTGLVKPDLAPGEMGDIDPAINVQITQPSVSDSLTTHNAVIPNGDNEIPDWKKSDTKFGWVKYSSREAWKPGFVYPDGLAQYVTKSGQLSDIKRPFNVFEKNIAKSSKRTFKQGLDRFNKRNHCHFE